MKYEKAKVAVVIFENEDVVTYSCEVKGAIYCSGCQVMGLHGKHWTTKQSHADWFNQIE